MTTSSSTPPSTMPSSSSSSSSSSIPVNTSTTTAPLLQKQQLFFTHPPVDILPTPTAQTYSHVHPALILAVYALRFPALVADPVSTLLSDLPIFAALQVGYVVTCLPQTGLSHHHHHHHPTTDAKGISPTEGSSSSSSINSSRGSTLLKVGKTPYRKKHSSHTTKSDAISGKLTAAFLSLTLTFLLGTPILAIVLVLFGAPCTTHIMHTILCAAHMSLLSATPLIYVHGVDSVAWKEVWAFACPADAVWGGALGAGVGAWLGAVPIPLDWDRPWQAYPITILTGAYLGYSVGSVIGRTPLLYGKRIEFVPPEKEREEEEAEAERGR